MFQLTDVVELHGLKKAKKYNKKLGVVIAIPNQTTDRFQVILCSGKLLAVKEANLSLKTKFEFSTEFWDEYNEHSQALRYKGSNILALKAQEFHQNFIDQGHLYLEYMTTASEGLAKVKKWKSVKDVWQKVIPIFDSALHAWWVGNRMTNEWMSSPQKLMGRLIAAVDFKEVSAGMCSVPDERLGLTTAILWQKSKQLGSMPQDRVDQFGIGSGEVLVTAIANTMRFLALHKDGVSCIDQSLGFGDSESNYYLLSFDALPILPTCVLWRPKILKQFHDFKFKKCLYIQVVDMNTLIVAEDDDRAASFVYLSMPEAPFFRIDRSQYDETEIGLDHWQRLDTDIFWKEQVAELMPQSDI